MARKRITVSVDAADFEFLKAAVDNGHFKSVSGAVAEAVRRMLQKQFIDGAETDADREFKRTLFGLRGSVDPDFDYGI